MNKMLFNGSFHLCFSGSAIPPEPRAPEGAGSHLGDVFSAAEPLGTSETTNCSLQSIRMENKLSEGLASAKGFAHGLGSAPQAHGRRTIKK